MRLLSETGLAGLPWPVGDRRPHSTCPHWAWQSWRWPCWTRPHWPPPCSRRSPSHSCWCRGWSPGGCWSPEEPGDTSHCSPSQPGWDRSQSSSTGRLCSLRQEISWNINHQVRVRSTNTSNIKYHFYFWQRSSQNEQSFPSQFVTCWMFLIQRCRCQSSSFTGEAAGKYKDDCELRFWKCFYFPTILFKSVATFPPPLRTKFVWKF